MKIKGFLCILVFCIGASIYLQHYVTQRDRLIAMHTAFQPIEAIQKQTIDSMQQPLLESKTESTYTKQENPDASQTSYERIQLPINYYTGK